MRLINPSQSIITAYANENDLERITANNAAKFRPDYQFFSAGGYRVAGVDEVNVKNLDWPELSSIYGGTIASEFSPTDQSLIVPRQSLYKIRLASDQDGQKAPFFTEKGMVYIHGDAQAPIVSFLQSTGEIFMREINLN